MGNAGLFNEVEGLISVKARTQNCRATGVDQRCHEDIRTADMEERQLQGGLVLTVDTPGCDGVDAVPCHVAMGQNRAFGQTGGTARVIDAPGVIHA